MGPKFKWPNLEKLAALVTVIGFPLLLASLFWAYELDGYISEQLTELKRIAQSQNNIALNQMVFGDPRNVGIIDAIESKKPILNTSGSAGQFSTVQLDKFLGDLETVGEVHDEGLLSDDELCASFSVYIQEAQRNQEVMDYLKANARYFSDLPKLFAFVTNSTNKNCRN
jgi:hypothetical protein